VNAAEELGGFLLSALCVALLFQNYLGSGAHLVILLNFDGGS
jgi:hypothetical protein